MKRTKAARQAAMAAKAVPLVPAIVVPVGVTITKAPEVAPARPLPASGQVWSAPIAASDPSKGRRFIAISTVGPDVAESYEVTKDGARVPDPIAKGVPIRTALDTREMPRPYRYEPTITAIDDTPDEGNNRASGAKETPMSANHTETVPAPKKTAAVAAMKKTAEKKVAKDAAKPKATPKAAKTTDVPTNRMKDDDVLAFAAKILTKDPETKKAAVLAALRAAGHSCSQERFAPSFNKAVKAAKAAAKG